jgi:hypothetical protein
MIFDSSECSGKRCFIYSQTCVQRPSLGLKKVAVVQRRSLFTVCSYKIVISFGYLGIRLVLVDRWLLFRGGC